MSAIDCDNKKKYRTKQEATDYADYYNSDFLNSYDAHTKGSLQVYRCSHHNCWHVGHPPSNKGPRVLRALDKLFPR